MLLLRWIWQIFRYDTLNIVLNRFMERLVYGKTIGSRFFRENLSLITIEFASAYWFMAGNKMILLLSMINFHYYCDYDNVIRFDENMKTPFVQPRAVFINVKPFCFDVNDFYSARNAFVLPLRTDNEWLIWMDRIKNQQNFQFHNSMKEKIVEWKIINLLWSFCM